MGHETLRTGEVASQAGVNVQTLRYYERRGLLREPARRASGYREYPPDAVRLVRFIKRAQELGFTLVEIGELVRLRGGGAESCSEVRAAAEGKIEGNDRKIGSLRSMRRSAAGFGFLLTERVLVPIIVVFLAAGIASIGWSTRSHRRAGPLAATIVGSAAVVLGHVVWSVPILLYGGVALLVAASLSNLWLKRPRPESLVQLRLARKEGTAS